MTRPGTIRIVCYVRQKVPKLRKTQTSAEIPVITRLSHAFLRRLRPPSRVSLGENIFRVKFLTVTGDE